MYVFPFFIAFIMIAFFTPQSGWSDTQYLSPESIIASRDGQRLYVAQRTAKRVDVIDLQTSALIRPIPLPCEPTGLAASRDGEALFVTGAADQGLLCRIDVLTGTITKQIILPPGSRSPVFDPTEQTLYVCNQFNNSVSVINAAKMESIATISGFSREPIACAASKDGRYLIVANHLPDGSALAKKVSAKVQIVDLASRRISKTISLPDGSSSVKDILISHDGTLAFVSHILGRYTVHTSQLDQGWMNTNAITIINMDGQKILTAVLLDDAFQGAANPWALGVDSEGKRLLVSHAGAGELSVINLEALLNKIRRLQKDDPNAFSEIPDRLGFLSGLRTRVRLPGIGQRGMAIVGDQVYLTEYFSDSLARVDLSKINYPKVEALPLGPKNPMTAARKGEALFHNARHCFQEWQSCSSCHPDGRADGLNWDLMNDGIGNPKNTRSLLLSHQTPPVMWTGVRPNAETAVRSGFKYIQFAGIDEDDAAAVDAYLKSVRPMPSPYLRNGNLTESARRGKALFYSEELACTGCHPAPLYTDNRLHDVGTSSEIDQTIDDTGALVSQKRFVTPTLIEAWRTAPYLHDGRFATLRELIDKDGHERIKKNTSQLSEAQIEDLVAFLQSL